MVYTPEGEPSFWFIPLLAKNYTIGFAYVELSSRVSKIGIFGASPTDRSSWVNSSFFEKPPSNILKEIQATYSEFKISEPIFSFDTSPAKWAWMLKIKSENKIKSMVFITPNNWYERHLNTKQAELERSP